MDGGPPDRDIVDQAANVLAFWDSVSQHRQPALFVLVAHVQHEDPLHVCELGDEPLPQHDQQLLVLA